MAASASLHTAFSSSALVVESPAGAWDDRVGVEQLVEGVKVARITRGQPAEHDRG